jgi:hypothetical protein
MHGGKFQGRQPESLTGAEWAEIAAFLTRGKRGEKPRDEVVEVTPLSPADGGEWAFV